MPAASWAPAVPAVAVAHARAYVDVILAFALVVLAIEDLRRRVIPNRIVLPATLLVLAGQLLVSPSAAAWGLLAGVGAALFFAVPSLLNGALVGMGDAKLALLIGAGLGPRVIDALLVGLLALLPVALAMLVFGGARAGRKALPLGPFLVGGALFVMLATGF
jgi:leader peptidase (prepilin peptidase)/N-methyltransferase